MFARVMSGQVHPDQLDHLLELVRNSSLGDPEQHPGFNGVYGLVDRSSRHGMLITLWESTGDLEHAEASGVLASVMTQVMRCLNGPAIRETYEVAIEA